ncbi:MAG: hypothetical protein KAJ20_02715 [Candidatus Aenigmarchaeota archaeon]|nr:hypothetical protein [Candidatus Aenigmarchaeota archaeon]
MIVSFIAIAMFIILAVLWTIDTVETCSLVDKEGLDVEENPVAKFFLKINDRDFVIFKLFDLAMLGGILYYIYGTNILAAETLLFAFTLVYAYTVVHNYIVISKCKGDRT